MADKKFQERKRLACQLTTARIKRVGREKRKLTSETLPLLSKPDGSTTMERKTNHEDAKLKELLNTWQPPPISSALDEQIFASFKTEFARAPWWQRFFTASIRIPVPALAAACLLAFAGFGIFAYKIKANASQPIATAPTITTITKTETVEVPVVHEKIVTKIVYVERPVQTPAAKIVPALAPSPLPRNEMKIASHIAGDNAYTNVDLSGYQPVEEMRVRIIKGSTKENESSAETRE